MCLDEATEINDYQGFPFNTQNTSFSYLRGIFKYSGKLVCSPLVVPQKMHRILLAVVALVLLGLTACLSRNDVPPTPEQTPDKKQIFEHANKLSAAHNELQIEGYIRRNGLDSMQIDGRGMYYKVWGTPIGPRPKEGIQVAIAYTAEMLDGTPCDRADTVAPLEIILGKRKQTVGLEELLLHVAPGQEAIGIVPPHLAYGVAGRGNEIPPNTSIVYHITWLRYTKQ